MRVRSTLAAVAVLVVAPLAVPATSAAAAPPPGITVLSVTGTGCRAGTAAAALSPDRTALTVTYNDYVVAGASRPVSRNCRIDLRIDPVPGFAPTITSVDNRGFAELAAGSVAVLTTTYGFRGGRTRVGLGWQAGPYSDNWATRDAAGNGLVAGTCRGSNVLDLDSALTLASSRAGVATDFVTMDSTDVVAPSTLRLSWKRCP
jgi:Domain of unknown function (DUF4360)